MPREDRERPVVENDDSLFPTADAAQNLINALSADQRAWVPIDSVRDRVIVQVTRGEDEVLAYLRENVEEPERITTETVRWSGENLATFADRLDTLPNASSWGYGLNSANGRIEVGVPGDAGEARRNSPRLSTRAPLESGTTYRPCDQTDVGMNSWAGTRNVSAAEAQTVP